MPIWPLTLLPRWDGHPQPSLQRFDGLTILVAGSSSTMGLEAAKKVAVAGASVVVVTAREETRAHAVKTTIEDHLASLCITTKPTIIPLTLEMTDLSSIYGFIKALRAQVSHLDHTILNAGINHSTYTVSPTNYETSIQVNAISTNLLSFNLLPLLLASPLTTKPDPASRPHLVFVSSGTAWMVDLPTTPVAPSSSTPMADLSTSANWPAAALVAGQVQYARSKLFLEYAMRRMAFLPVLNAPGTTPDAPASNPRVLVTSVCPGYVATNLGRSYVEKSWLMGAAVLLLALVSKPAELGANVHVSALGRGLEVRGEMWKNDAVLAGETVKNVKDPEGLALGARVWEEMKGICRRADEEHGDGTVARMLEGEDRTPR